MENFKTRFKKEWIRDGLKKDCITFTEDFGKFLSQDLKQFEKLTTSQIRNVFGEIKRIQMKGFNKEMHSFLLLKPKMAYAAGRHNLKGINTFKDIFEMAHDVIDPDDPAAEKQFNNFVDMFESVLAYHKAYGGK